VQVLEDHDRRTGRGQLVHDLQPGLDAVDHRPGRVGDDPQRLRVEALERRQLSIASRSTSKGG